MKSLSDKFKFLNQHGVDCMMQNSKLLAVDERFYLNKLRRTWIDVSDVNVILWAGY